MTLKIFHWNIIVALLTLKICLTVSVIRNKRAVISTQSTKWTNRTIPYYIDEAVFNVEELTQLHDAIDAWNMETCVIFRKKTNEDKNWIKITDGTQCHSFVGMNEEGEQILSLASPDCRFYGTYLHELGHVLGLLHEHTRPGRNHFIHVHRDKIQEGHEEFYNENDMSELNSYNLPYDLQSVMHYGSKSFSGQDGQPTINVKNNSLTHLLEEVDAKDLSFLDVKIINLHYKCADLCERKVSCPENGYVDKFCQCHIPETFEARRCRNKNEDEWCIDQKKLGNCEYKSKYMSVNCRKTCDKCYKYKTIFKKREKICKNFEKDQTCENWSKRGECQKNPGYMNIKCKKSCGICVEEITTPMTQNICINKLEEDKCDRLMSDGECFENKKYMKVNCQKTCGFCDSKTQMSTTTQSTDLCFDKLSENSCKRWAENNECKTHSKFMQKMCRKTCKHCQLENLKIQKDLCKNVYSDSLCEFMKVKCRTNAPFMKLKCKKTCEMCTKYPNPNLTTSPPCKDVYSNEKCKDLKSKGRCERYPYFMSIKCFKTCRNCRPISEIANSTNCTNNETLQKCQELANKGKCKSELIYMSRNCAKTCNLCFSSVNQTGCRNLESDKQCELWSKNNNCSVNASFLMVQCAKTCKRCNAQGYEECQDSYRKDLCRLWKETGRCYKTPTFMLHHCAQSCGSCDLKLKGISNFVCKNVFDDKLCQLWKTDGECKTNRKFMMENCGKTCGTCRTLNETDSDSGYCVNEFSDRMCNVWKSLGFCSAKYRNVMRKCSKACGKCNTTKDKCQNLYNGDVCEKWKQSGECEKNPNFMKLQCRKSCQFCKKNSTEISCKNLLSEQDCEIHAKKDLCEKNPTYMLKMCAKTCNNCSHFLKSMKTNTSCTNIFDIKRCELWKLDGECIKNPVFMLKNCARSCGYCYVKPKIDFNCINIESEYKCEQWGRSGECDNNPRFMLVSCAKSCNKRKKNPINCPLVMPVTPAMSTESPSATYGKSLNVTTIAPILSNCSNLFRDDICEEWKKIGSCQNNHKLMFSQCRKSCGRCRKVLECQNVYDDQSCENWAKKGKCEKNMKFMLMLCTKSCGKCSLLNFQIEEPEKHVKNRCQNKYGELTCEALKDIGECQKSSLFMKDKCAKTCGLCHQNVTYTSNYSIKPSRCRNVYKDKICDEWAESGMCRSTSTFTLAVCSKSCTNCTGKILKRFMKCQNKAGDGYCDKLQSRGHCKTFPNLMRIKCALSCKKCDLNSYTSLSSKKPTKFNMKLNCRNIAGDFQCSYWARQNQCEKNPSFMRISCRKACNACEGEKQKVNCVDIFSTIKCRTWANRGECNRQKVWMNENCAKSCKICQDFKDFKYNKEDQKSTNENKQ